MTYTINNNAEYNSKEIYFDEKPSAEIREALKALKFRWHRVKKCWYGFAEEDEIRAAIENDPMKDYTIDTHEGYLGAVAFDGSNSHKMLYGVELCKAIRAAFKKCGIKGVTVRKETYTGGQSLYFTITPSAGDIVPLEDFINASTLSDFRGFGWIQDPDTGESVSYERAMCEWSEEQKARALEILAARKYNAILAGESLNEHFIGEYKIFTDKFKALFSKIRKIVLSFNYDDSNSMVDYFDRGFYEHYQLKAA